MLVNEIILDAARESASPKGLPRTLTRFIINVICKLEFLKVEFTLEEKK